MNRFTARLICAGLGLVIFLCVHFARKGSHSDQFRKQAHSLVARAEGYSARPDYYDWLVDTAHDEVFSDSYHTEHRGRYGERAWVDKGAYMQSLFDAMIAHAREDKALGVVDAITKLRDADASR